MKRVRLSYGEDTQRYSFEEVPGTENDAFVIEIPEDIFLDWQRREDAWEALQGELYSLDLHTWYAWVSAQPENAQVLAQAHEVAKMFEQDTNSVNYLRWLRDEFIRHCMRKK